jgi:hypothetical protein
MVTLVPPAVDPGVGEIPVTVGAGGNTSKELLVVVRFSDPFRLSVAVNVSPF